MAINKHIINIFGLLLVSACIGAIAPAHAQQADRSSSVFAKKTEPVDDPIDVRAVENRIIVNHAPVDSTMEIYTIIGTKIKEIKIKQSSGEYAVSFPKGYYIVRIADTVRKIVIR